MNIELHCYISEDKRKIVKVKLKLKFLVRLDISLISHYISCWLATANVCIIFDTLRPV